jgi:hypothetical protein
MASWEQVQRTVVNQVVVPDIQEHFSIESLRKERETKMKKFSHSYCIRNASKEIKIISLNTTDNSTLSFDKNSVTFEEKSKSFTVKKNEKNKEQDQDMFEIVHNGCRNV